VAAVCVKRVCRVANCVTMVSEIAFDDNASQWEMWRKDKEGYGKWLQGKIEHRSNGLTVSDIAGQYQERSRDVGNCREGLSSAKGENHMTATAVASARIQKRPPDYRERSHCNGLQARRRGRDHRIPDSSYDTVIQYISH